MTWAAAKGLAIDPAYPQSALLGFVLSEGDDRFWVAPSEPERRPYFISSLLHLLGETSSCFAWRHLGCWPSVGDVDPLRINDVVEHRFLYGLGMPMGTDNVVEFSADERDMLVALMFLTTIFGWSVGEDLYVVPDHARVVLQVSHHSVIYACFRDGTEVETWVAEMVKCGFPLPSELPDATFKRPDWM